MKYQGRSTRTKTGGRIRPHSGKRKHELGHDPTETRVDEPTLRTVDARGNRQKVRALTTNVANVAATDGTTTQATIQSVVENPANPNYARRNIITRGATLAVETDGTETRARVTSRPGQTGHVNCVELDD